MRHVIGAWSDRLSTQTPRHRQQTIEAAYAATRGERSVWILATKSASFPKPEAYRAPGDVKKLEPWTRLVVN